MTNTKCSPQAWDWKVQLQLEKNNLLWSLNTTNRFDSPKVQSPDHLMRLIKISSVDTVLTFGKDAFDSSRGSHVTHQHHVRISTFPDITVWGKCSNYLFTSAHWNNGIFVGLVTLFSDFFYLFDFLALFSPIEIHGDKNEVLFVHPFCDGWPQPNATSYWSFLRH